VFCDIRSWLTGRRLVSLPFSDHCEPLVDAADVRAVCAALDDERRRGRWRYIELRPLVTDVAQAFGRSETFCLHLLDLGRTNDELFSGFHRTATQQMIRRAEREALVCESGRDDRMLQTFHALVTVTRQRHGLPPQPLIWFRNLATELGDALTIRIATAAGRPVAGIVTLHHRRTLTFKYGASDAAFHKLGGMQLLLWRAIQHARVGGCDTMDFGRTALEQDSLLVFKDRWGAVRESIAYSRYPTSNPLPSWIKRSAEQALRRVPAPLLATAGKYLYKHVA
jgi:lipid II:glycine glycyltransferase (peptidoglycan interpeptide bridge formation enzyme)